METAAFASVYQTGLVDDEPIEIRPLDLDHDFRTSQGLGDEDVVMDDSQDYEREDREDGANAEDEDEEDPKNKYVTFREIQAAARNMKERPEVRKFPGLILPSLLTDGIFQSCYHRMWT